MTVCGVLACLPVHADPATAYTKEIVPLLEMYCYDCHGEGESKGKFSMDEFKDLPAHLSNRKHWLPVWQNLRSQVMPPSDKDQPSVEEKKKLLAWIEKDVFKLDRVRLALRRGDIAAAKREANVFELTPVL